MELRPILAEILKRKTTETWQEIFDNSGIPNGPINTIEKVIVDPQVLFREMIIEVEHPIAGILKMPGVPIKMSETQGAVRNASPVLGEHTIEILKELIGLNQVEIDELYEAHIF
jgi:CoA:oxalate CoA-transferase